VVINGTDEARGGGKGEGVLTRASSGEECIFLRIQIE